MLELGNQLIDGSKTGKEYYISLGHQHTSVDLNGNNGSLKKDLRYPNEFIEWHNTFDIITNAGTTEHVEPVEYQYECFSILHDCLKVNGIQLHVVPCVEGLHDLRWSKHCTIYYSMDFYKMLVEKNSYELIEMKLSENNLLLVCLRKTLDRKFMTDKNIFKKHLHLVPENLGLDGDSSTRITK
jgi:hypothetical protein